MSDHTERRDRARRALLAVEWPNGSHAGRFGVEVLLPAVLAFADAELVPVLARAEEAEAARDAGKVNLAHYRDNVIPSLAEHVNTQMARAESAEAALVSLRGRVEGLADEFGARSAECRTEGEHAASDGDTITAQEWYEATKVYRTAEREARAVLAAEPTPPGEDCRADPVAPEAGAVERVREYVTTRDGFYGREAGDEDLLDIAPVDEGDAPALLFSDLRALVGAPGPEAYDDRLTVEAPTPPAAPQAEGARVPCKACGKPVKVRAHGFPVKHKPPEDYEGVISGDGETCIGSLRFHSMNPYNRPAPAPQVEGGEGA